MPIVEGLRKTTILPTDDAALAQSILRHWINEEPVVVIVVLGKTDEDETFVTRADSLTGVEADARRVVWARVPADIRPVLKELATKKFSAGALEASRGFSLALANEVRDLLPREKPAPAMDRVLLAWARAEA